jgi:hypothetical protein
VTITAPDIAASRPSLLFGGESSFFEKKLTLVLLSIFALGLRLHHLSTKSIWTDEAFSVQMARLSWSDFAFLIKHQEPNMAAYYLLLRFWTLFGIGEGFVRGLSVLFSVLTVPLLYLLGKRLFGETAGLLAAGLLAVNAYHIRYAQEARSYAMLIFLIVLATWILVRNLQEPAAHWGWYTAVCLLAVYTHFFAVFFLAVHLVALIYIRRIPPPRYALLFILFTVPLGFAIRTASPIQWIPALQASMVLGFFSAIAGNGGMYLLAIEAVAIASAVWYGRNFGYFLTLSWLFVPVLLTLGISLLQPCFLARYLSPCLSAMVLLIAAGITRLKRLPATLLASTILVLSTLGTLSYYKKDFDLYRGDWRTASSFILDRTQAGDDLYYVTFSAAPLEYYKMLRNTSWPRSIAPQRDLLLRTSIGEELSNSRTPGDRVWLVLDGEGRTNAMLRAYFGKGRRIAEEQSFSDSIHAILFVSRARCEATSTACSAQAQNGQPPVSTDKP